MSRTLDSQIMYIQNLAITKQYGFTISDAFVMGYALAAAQVTNLLTDDNKVTPEAIEAFIAYDKTDVVQVLDTVFETLVDLELTTWPAGYNKSEDSVEPVIAN